MTLQEKLKELIEEMDRVHPEGVVDPKAWDLTEGNGLPDSVTAENGYERFFTKKARATLRDFVGIRYESDRAVSSVMDVKQFGQLVRQCITVVCPPVGVYVPLSWRIVAIVHSDPSTMIPPR